MNTVKPPFTQFDIDDRIRAKLAKLLREGWNDAEIIRVATGNAFRLRDRQNRARRWVSYTAFGDVPTLAGQVWLITIDFAPPTCTPTGAGMYFLWNEDIT